MSTGFKSLIEASNPHRKYLPDFYMRSGREMQHKVAFRRTSVGRARVYTKRKAETPDTMLSRGEGEGEAPNHNENRPSSIELETGQTGVGTVRLGSLTHTDAETHATPKRVACHVVQNREALRLLGTALPIVVIAIDASVTFPNRRDRSATSTRVRRAGCVCVCVGGTRAQEGASHRTSWKYSEASAGTSRPDGCMTYQCGD